MIEINLVPENMRKKKKGPSSSQKMISLPNETIIGLGAGLIFVLVMAHIGLEVMYFNKQIKFKQVEKKLNAIQPDKKKLDLALNELRSLQGQIAAVEKVLKEKQIQWSLKLNSISDSMSNGIWLTNVSLTSEYLIIQGSSVSTKKEEVINAHIFASNLKKQKDFMDPFSSLDVGSIQRRKLNAADLADFTITAKLK